LHGLSLEFKPSISLNLIYSNKPFGEAMRIVIAGGGIMGVCSAAFLRQLGFEGEILVFEQDISFAKSSTHLSAASLRTQFSTPLCVQMSRFGLAEIRHAQIPFEEGGYLYLVSKEDEKNIIAQNDMQRALKAEVQLLSRDTLQKRFPFLELEGIALGSLGEKGEGWFDASLLHSHYKQKSGIKFINKRVTKLLGGEVELNTGEREVYDIFINATGALAARLMPELPVEPRKRTIFVAKPKTPLPDLPLLIDKSGLWVRPEKELILIGGGEDPMNDPPAHDDFEPNYALFEEKLWPLLAGRLPQFESLKLIRAWAGHYDYNIFDQNAIIGRMDRYKNAYCITGFSGHGLQHGAAAGRGLAELIVKGAYQTLDLTAFAFERVLKNKPLVERNVI
jgi:FAD-dependent oxidoreductase domain-containing protein 1